MKTKNKQAGYTVRGIIVVLVLLGIAAGFLVPRYFWQFEKLRAMSMQAMLINVMIAQEAYHAKEGTYTDKWADLLAYVSQPESLETQLQAVAGEPQKYFFGFGKNAAKKQKGYMVSLSVAQDKQGGTISAVRTHSLLYKYTFTRAFPDGDTQCVASGRQERFCKKIMSVFEEFSLSNLVPVPAQNASQTEAKNPAAK